MAVYRCKSCGAALEIKEGQSVVTCDYCDVVQTVPKANDEKKMTLFTRANKLRSACEFDKAAGIFESIIAEFPEEAEAYWGLVLCKYGIEYVDDPKTGKKIPTCRRLSYDSVMDDGNFELAMENADVLARKVYVTEAKAFEEIRKGIMAISSTEEPYDVFICYKETDEFGDRTVDSKIAQDVYDRLDSKGYRVFFSRITLEGKLGVEYEPYIFAALNSAKIMLVFGSCYEYFHAVWVKNEWSRFLDIKAKDNEKRIIPCYVDVNDIPKEIRGLQGQDISKIGADQDIVRGIEKIIPKKTQVILQQTAVVASAEVNKQNSLLDRGRMALEDGDWKKADSFFEDVLNNDSKCADAYIGKALAFEQCRTLTALVRKRKDAATVRGSSNYKVTSKEAYAREMANKYKVKGYLNDNDILNLYKFDLSYSSSVAEAKRLKEKEKAYWDEHKWLSKAVSFASSEVAASIENAKKEITDYLDSVVKKEELSAKEKVEKIEADYASHVEAADAKLLTLHEKAVKRRDADYKYFSEDANNLKDTQGLENALAGLKKMHPYNDSANLIKLCEDKIKANIDAANAEIARKAKEKEDKIKSNKTVLLVTTALMVVVAFVGGLMNYRYSVFGMGMAETIGAMIGIALIQVVLTLPVLIPAALSFITAVKKDNISRLLAVVTRVIAVLLIIVFGFLYCGAAFIGKTNAADLIMSNWCFCVALNGLIPFITLFFKKKDE